MNRTGNETEMTTEHASRYTVPGRWVHYDLSAVFHLLIEAKTADGVLKRMPYLPQWIESALRRPKAPYSDQKE